MTPRTKYILFGISGAALLFAVAATVAIMLFPAEKVRGIVETEASKAMKMPVKIGKLGLTFWGAPAVRVSDVTVGPARDGEPPLLEMKSFSARVAFMPLVTSRRLEIVSAAADKPRITLVTRRDGSQNLPAADSTKTKERGGAPAIPVPITMKSFTLKGGSVTMIDEAKDGRTVLDDIDQHLSLHIGGGGKTLASDGKLAVKDISLFSKGKRLPFSGASLGFTHEVSGDLKAGTIKLDKGLLTLNGLPIGVTGALEEWKKVTFRVDTGTLDAAKLIAAIPDSLFLQKKDVAATGTVKLALDGILDLAGAKPKASWNGELAIRDMSAAVKGFPKKVDALKCTAAITDTTLVFRDTEIRIGGSKASLAGTVRGYMAAPVLDLRTTGSVSLDEAVQALPMLAKSGLAGGLVFDIAANGPPKPDSLLLNGTADLKSLKFSIPKALKNPAEVTGSLRITPSAADLTNLAVKTGKSDFTVTGKLSDYRNLLPSNAKKGAPARLTGTLSSRLIDIGDMLIIDKSAPLVKPWDLEKPLKNMPIPPTLSAELGLRLGKIAFGKLAADSTRGSVNLSKGVLSLAGLTVGAYLGTLTGAMKMDFSDSNRIAYDGGFDLNKLDASAFISSFFGTGDFFRGELSSQLAFSGAGLDSVSFMKNLKGSGMATFVKGQFVNWEFTKGLGKSLKFLNFDTLDFENLKSGFTVQDQRVTTPALVIATSYGDLTLVGSTGFDTTLDFDISFKLNSKAVSLASKNNLGDLASIISGSSTPELYLVAKGTLKKPEFTIDKSRSGKAVKERLQSEAEKLLQKQDSELQKQGQKLLKKLFK